MFVFILVFCCFICFCFCFLLELIGYHVFLGLINCLFDLIPRLEDHIPSPLYLHNSMRSPVHLLFLGFLGVTQLSVEFMVLVVGFLLVTTVSGIRGYLW